MRILDFSAAKIGSSSLLYSSIICLYSVIITVTMLLQWFVDSAMIEASAYAILVMLKPFGHVFRYNLAYGVLLLPPMIGLFADSKRGRSIIAIVLLIVALVIYSTLAEIAASVHHGLDMFSDYK